MKPWWLRLAPYVNQEKRSLAALFILMLLGIASEALLPWPIKLVLDQVLAGDKLPRQVNWLGSLPGASEASGLLAWLVACTIALFLFSKGTYIGRSILQSGAGARMQYNLAKNILAHLQMLTVRYHSRASKGDLVRRMAEDTSCVSNLVFGALLPSINSVLMLAVLYSIMWRISRSVAIVAIAVSVPLGLLMKLLAPSMMRRAYDEQQSQGELWSISERALTALPLVQAFGREIHEELRFRKIASITVHRGLLSTALQILFTLGVQGITAIGTALILVLGGFQALNGLISVGTLVVLLSYANLLYEPLIRLAYVSPIVSSAAASARRVKEVLDSNSFLAERPNAEPLSKDGKKISGHIRFENISFKYDQSSSVLKDISLEILPGEIIAFVGPSGAGKSTLVSLVPRLLDPSQGRVLIDGRDIRDLKLSSIRAQISVLLQDPFLLPTSVANNIAYGKPDASVRDIVSAATAAGAADFIEKLPEGYQTIIGERGTTLSGGQRQRLAIARAILKDSPILILDEPTSALDPETEDWVMNAVVNAGPKRTTMIIAHRLSTVRRADRIVVMDTGKIVEVGKHQELIRNEGMYSELCRQSSPEGIPT